jgi:hypothetical protein
MALVNCCEAGPIVSDHYHPSHGHDDIIAKVTVDKRAQLRDFSGGPLEVDLAQKRRGSAWLSIAAPVVNGHRSLLSPDSVFLAASAFLTDFLFRCGRFIAEVG